MIHIGGVKRITGSQNCANEARVFWENDGVEAPNNKIRGGKKGEAQLSHAWISPMWVGPSRYGCICMSRGVKDPPLPSHTLLVVREYVTNRKGKTMPPVVCRRHTCCGSGGRAGHSATAINNGHGVLGEDGQQCITRPSTSIRDRGLPTAPRRARGLSYGRGPSTHGRGPE